MGLIGEMTSSIANWISASRLVILVPLWIWVSQGRYTWVAWGLIYVAVSNVLDGTLARLLKQCSQLGEKLDSWGDHLILISSVVWLGAFRAEVFPDGRLLWMIPPAAFYLVVIAIGLIKHHHFGGAHILEGKPLGIFGYVVVVLAMFGVYSEVAYIGMLVFWILLSALTLLYHFRPDLFANHQRSLILGLLGLDFEKGPIRYFFS